MLINDPRAGYFDFFSHSRSRRPRSLCQCTFTNTFTFPSCRHLVTSASELLLHHRTGALTGSLVRHLVAPRSNENVIFQDAYYYHRQDTSPPRLRSPLRSPYLTRRTYIAFPRCFPSLLFGCTLQLALSLTFIFLLRPNTFLSRLLGSFFWLSHFIFLQAMSEQRLSTYCLIISHANFIFISLRIARLFNLLLKGIAELICYYFIMRLINISIAVIFQWITTINLTFLFGNETLFQRI